jgi:Spy/CpxP family protein refolding chaperone
VLNELFLSYVANITSTNQEVKMKNVLLSLLVLASVSIAKADEAFQPHKHSCHAELNLSDAQKSEIKKLYTDSKASMKALIIAAKKSKFAFYKVLAQPESTKAQAIAAAKAMKTNIIAIKKIKNKNKMTVLFDILSPEQRVKEITCLAHKKKHGHHRGHHHGRHHGQHGHHTHVGQTHGGSTHHGHHPHHCAPQSTGNHCL